MISLRDATATDVEFVAENLRDADTIELRLAQTHEPAEAVRLGAAMSIWTRVLCLDGRPAALYGVAPMDLPDCGSPWMLATDDIGRISHAFLVASRGEAERMCRQFRFLFNQVHRDNRTSIKWLLWLGFSIDYNPSGPYGQFFSFWKGEFPCVTR